MATAKKAAKKVIEVTTARADKKTFTLTGTIEGYEGDVDAALNSFLYTAEDYGLAATLKAEEV